jgi:hypothetical protein
MPNNLTAHDASLAPHDSGSTGSSEALRASFEEDPYLWSQRVDEVIRTIGERLAHPDVCHQSRLIDARDAHGQQA